MASYHILFIALAAFIIGISKAGIRGLDAFQVVLMALVFGSKQSTGVVLPLLCVADIMAVLYYKKSVNWSIFWRLMPSMIIGVFLGLFFGKQIDERLFKIVMTSIVLATLLLLFLSEYRKKGITPHSVFYTHSMGLVAGFTTMIGNLAGAFANIYFLGLKIGKEAFLGTVSYVFLCINLFKVPLQIFYWENITSETLKKDLFILPFVLIGFWVGIKIVGRINEESFRKIVLIMTIIGSVFLIFSA